MNKEGFLKELRDHLRVLDEREQEDIIDEYAQHIDLKMKSGLSEEEAISDFGNIAELAAEILEAYHVDPKFEEKTKGIVIRTPDMEKVSEGSRKLAGKAAAFFGKILEKIRKMPTGMTMEQLKRAWYGGEDGSYEHYHWTRYYALNLHSVFYRGTLEWRCFESTLHAGRVRANITLALAISAQAINQKKTLMRKTEISENPAFTFRTFLLRLGLIGPEYKNVRQHLLENLPGDRAWRYDKTRYPSLNQRRNER